MVTGQAFLAQRYIDDILIQIQNEAPQLGLGYPNEVKFCLKREKHISFSDKIYLLRNFFVNI